MPFNWRYLWKGIKVYWKSILLFVIPIGLLPVFLVDNQVHFRCLYCILLITFYWIFEILPITVTSFIPVVLFPIMGILSSHQTALNYLKEVNMLFIGGLAIANVMEYVNLHIRIALNVMNIVGVSPRKLLTGLMIVTIFISMWISNTAATSMMIPIVEAVMLELESQGFGRIYEPLTVSRVTLVRRERGNKGTKGGADDDDEEEEIVDDIRVPTSRTACYMIATAYAAGIGGLGTIIGSNTNIAAVGLIEASFPNGPGVSFISWMLLCLPIMIITSILTIVFMQIWYLGLFRPKSKDAQDVEEIKQGDAIAKEVIKNKIKELGPMSYNEIILLIILAISLLLWFFRKPEFIPGWAQLFTDGDTIKDSSVAMLALLVIALALNKPKGKDKPSVDLWTFLENKMSWGVMFLLGCGFAIADATKVSGLNDFIADKLMSLSYLPNYGAMVIYTFLIGILTQFTSNVAAASIFLPIMASVAEQQKIHPYVFMLSCGIAASFAFTLPVSTPPNAIALEPFNIRPIEMIKVGIFITIFCLLVLWAIFPFLGRLIFHLDEFPEWANKYKAIRIYDIE